MAAISTGNAGSAARLLRPLAWEGSAVAETGLGLIAASADPAAAAARYYRGAERGYAPAQLLLARSLAAGIGTPRRPAEALRWAFIAHARGHGPVRDEAGRLAASLAAGLGSTATAEVRKHALAWRPWGAMP